MPTEIRPELSKKNKYWLPKHRYYELKHFVMQYPDWKEILDTIEGRANTKLLLDWIKSSETPNPVHRAYERREYYRNNIDICDKAAKETDPVIGPHILEAVIAGDSFDKARARLDIPCGKDMYYELYRKFFWLLDAARR